MKDTCPSCGKKVDKDFKFCPFCFQDFDAENSPGSEVNETEPQEGAATATKEQECPEVPPGSEVPPRSEEPEELIIGKKYRILEPLHSSLYGTVCKAEQKDDPENIIVLRDFLLRERNPQKKEALINAFSELADKFSRLAHENLAEIHENLSEDNYIYLVFDYINGKFLDQVLLDYQIKRGKIIPAQEITRWGYQLCNLLIYIHSHLPGDAVCVNLKPYSLMIQKSDLSIMFVHLGLVEFCSLLGVLEHYEPQLMDFPKESYGVYEMYSLGGVLYYLATGINIFQGEQYQSVEKKRPDIPGELLSIIVRLLSMPHKPTFSGVEMVRDALQKLLPEEPAPIVEVVEQAEHEEPQQLLWQDYMGNKGRTNSSGEGPSYPLAIKWTSTAVQSMQNFLVPHRDALLSLTDKGNIALIDYATGIVRKKECLNINPVAPIVVGDQLCISSSSTQLSVNIADLSKRWDFRTKSMVLCSPALIQGKLCYVAYDGILIFADPQDGKALSMENLGAKIIATPAFDDARLYIPTLTGSIVAISISEHTIIWQQNTKSAISSAPAILKDRIYFGNNKGKIFSLCRVTGEVKWEVSLKGSFSQSVRAIDDRIFAVSSAGDFVSIDADTGSILWSIDFKPHKDYNYAVTRKFIYLIDRDNNLLIIDTQNGEIKHQHTLPEKPNGIPPIYNETIFVPLSSGKVIALWGVRR